MARQTITAAAYIEDHLWGLRVPVKIVSAAGTPVVWRDVVGIGQSGDKLTIGVGSETLTLEPTDEVVIERRLPTNRSAR